MTRDKIIISILLVLFIYGVYQEVNSSINGPRGGGPVPAERQAGVRYEDIPQWEIDRQRAQQAAQTQARVQRLISKGQQIKSRKIAVTHTRQARERLAFAASAAYQQVVATNIASWQALLAEAQKTESGRVYCTICDGDQYLPFCVMCKDGWSECGLCKGSGMQGDHTCPACLGSTWCYLCTGTWEMLCPFCSSGEVDSVINAKQPSFKVPLLLGDDE